MTPAQADQLRRALGECRHQLTVIRSALVADGPHGTNTKRELTAAIDAVHEIEEHPNSWLERIALVQPFKGFF